jgi:serine/threonine protein phosphatase 1
MDFSDDIEAHHERLDKSEWDRIYVVGDVHGCREELDRLLSELNPSSDHLVVFVGDLVKKGPDSRGVINLVRSSPNLLSVRGNNEEELLGGGKALPGLTGDDLDWIASLPAVVSWDGVVVTHAGIDPRKPPVDHTVEDLQTVRSLAPEGGYTRPFWFDNYEGPPRIFFGHTVLEDPVVGPHAVGLDTGCVYGGALTAYDCRRDETISVEPDRTYERPHASMFISPSRNQV